MSLLAVRGLTRRPWFENRALELDAGEVVVLQGPTGSGKSLFLRAIADLDPADGGAVLLRGAERGSMPATEWRAKVLYVHQAGVRLPGTVGANLDRIRELKVHRHRPAPAPGLDPAKDGGRLSGGEAQVLALERALFCEPEVLLVDEATSAMDRALADRWEERLRAWAAGGRAILWIAHDEGLADRVGARRETFP